MWHTHTHTKKHTHTHFYHFAPGRGSLSLTTQRLTWPLRCHVYQVSAPPATAEPHAPRDGAAEGPALGAAGRPRQRGHGTTCRANIRSFDAKKMDVCNKTHKMGIIYGKNGIHMEKTLYHQQYDLMLGVIPKCGNCTKKLRPFHGENKRCLTLSKAERSVHDILSSISGFASCCRYHIHWMSNTMYCATR